MLAYSHTNLSPDESRKCPTQAINELRLALHGSHFRRYSRATFNSGQLTPENRPKIPTGGKAQMKLIFTGLIALCTVAATFADEGKFGPAWSKVTITKLLMDNW
jgi:hypothetical protein